VYYGQFKLGFYQFELKTKILMINSLCTIFVDTKLKVTLSLVSHALSQWIEN